MYTFLGSKKKKKRCLICLICPGVLLIILCQIFNETTLCASSVLHQLYWTNYLVSLNVYFWNNYGFRTHNKHYAWDRQEFCLNCFFRKLANNSHILISLVHWYPHPIHLDLIIIHANFIFRYAYTYIYLRHDLTKYRICFTLCIVIKILYNTSLDRGRGNVTFFSGNLRPQIILYYWWISLSDHY